MGWTIEQTYKKLKSDPATMFQVSHRNYTRVSKNIPVPRSSKYTQRFL